MQLFDPEEFLKDKKDDMFYVGFFKSAKEWFPLCIVGNPEQSRALDTLVLASSYQSMLSTLEEYKQKIAQLEDIFVQYLVPEEIRNLIERYALKNLCVLNGQGLGGPCGGGGCDCGCNCG